eukprot:8207048-Ditylum_brightwellii.AAC.1
MTRLQSPKSDRIPGTFPPPTYTICERDTDGDAGGNPNGLTGSVNQVLSPLSCEIVQLCQDQDFLLALCWAHD